ncbi:hypothetical protein BDA99DRAFT_563111 [Phascolomyces articulosus]|uniref:Brain protein I3 n=1 Tax=Phascolomyces articulosus TaxID=60185 RepID=A0AAD5PAZ0_9FUNG|nr:hypothetical protein BDA99DRAFT_563111 [Phascolomyces articulosus]
MEKNIAPPAYQYNQNQNYGYANPPAANQQQPPPPMSSSDYPGVVGATPGVQRGIQGYDNYGQPIRPPCMEQRYQIEQSLGPACPQGGYHELRMHYTNSTLLFAILILPYLCGWRGKRECVCKRCGEKFPNIILPEPQ